MQGVILAAGNGTRLKPLTIARSKAMITVANKPCVEWIYEAMKRHAKEVFFVVRQDQQDIIKHFEGRAQFIFQDKPLGTGDAVLRCKDRVGGRFIVSNGDILVTRDDMRKIAKSKEPAVSAFRAENPQEYGIFEESGGSAIGIEEKPKKPRGDLANAGIYVFDDDIFERLEKNKKSQRGERELTDAIKFPAKMHVIEKRCEITFPWEILDANKFILEEHGSQIHPSAEIREGAFIEKNVAIGAKAVIGPNCFIRGYSSVGENCKVGNAVEVKNSVIMENSFISHLSYVGDSVIGSNCNVAGGTIFANLRLDQKNIGMKINGKYVDSGRKKLGAIVADGVQFGVNCTVMPGKRIWPNLLIPPCTIIAKDIEKQPSLKVWKRVLD
ncbi:MAG: NTP transferase domain-containing protein [Candidatus Aenigmarchaeota archaeon]|nr:NTP transferase domain-containing protein [Candidatus Aenigmarchaeota archaeon]